MDWDAFWEKVQATKKVSDHIYLTEYQCHHCKLIPPLSDDFKEMVKKPEGLESILEAMFYLFQVFEDLRKLIGKPIQITSGFRCIEHQRELRELGYKAAKISPHNFGVALDLHFKNPEETKAIVDLINQNHPEIRMGARKYNYEIVHIDTAYMINLDYIDLKDNQDYLPVLRRNWKPRVRW